MFRRRCSENTIKPKNNQIIYSATSKVTPLVTTGWGANFLSSESTFDPTTSIGVWMFDGDITTIPNSAFKQISNLTSIIYIPSTVHTIDSYAFRFDEANTSLRSQLQSICFNEGLMYINNRAFLSNRNLKEINLPNSIYKIGDYAFNGCINTKKITIGENLRMFAKSSNTGVNDASGLMWGMKLETVVWNAINCNDFISSEYSPFVSVNLLGTSEHEKHPIKNVHFGDKVKNIPGALFWKCPNISNEIVIPSSCERIGDRAFQACTSIKTVFVYATKPPKIEPNTTSGTAFQNSDGKNVIFRQYINNTWKVLPNITIFVPSESLEAYINDANWSVYASVIKAFRPEYKSIDLGLRTSDGKKILFADRNVFAVNEYIPGSYNAWGDKNCHYIAYNKDEKQPFLDNYIFDKTTYKYSNDTYTSLTKYNSSDNLKTLDYWDDPACVHLGGTWRTPTSSELELLLDESKFKKVIIDEYGNEFVEGSGNLIKGIRFVSKIPGFEGNSIFFGAFGAGNEDKAQDVGRTVSLWCSDLHSSNKFLSKFLYLYIDQNTNQYVVKISETNRYYGRQTRAVRIE